MPHLSPMNWIMAISMFWLTMIMLSTKSWWNPLSSMPFKIKSSTTGKNKQPFTWKWNW